MAKRSWLHSIPNRRAVAWIFSMGIASLTTAHAQERLAPSSSNSLLSHPVIGELLVPGTVTDPSSADLRHRVQSVYCSS